MRDRLIAVARQGRDRCRDGAIGTARFLWHWAIFTVTREKMIQAVLTGAVFAVISLTAENVGITTAPTVNAVPYLNVHPKTVQLGLMVGVAIVALWADAHTEQWRDLIRDVSGDEEAVDKAEEADDGDEAQA